MKQPVYITAASAISIQEPLSESWMQHPVVPQGGAAYAREPDYTPFVKPLEARRMGKLLKRATATAQTVLRQTGIARPEAILTGTGHGCVQNTLTFLNDLCQGGEQMLKPTCFMQSTHNTIGSLTGIQTGSHGYNSTYAHGGTSFECALMNAWDLLQLGRVHNALVSAHDELTDDYYPMLQASGYADGRMTCPTTEASVSCMLQTAAEGPVLLQGVDVLYRPAPEQLLQALDALLEEAGLQRTQVDALLTGANGSGTDRAYDPLTHALPQCELLTYKHLFGESFSAGALGCYVAQACLRHDLLPACLRRGGEDRQPAPRHWLVANCFDGTDYSLILLSKCCDY
ncbi:MAG: beta-ketoacyl synthase chain length factor [Paludibacteraceae bacterium]|nr:beta-ketoacyl synthase chain length factor [Paludibacteraceae bacterium]